MHNTFSFFKRSSMHNLHLTFFAKNIVLIIVLFVSFALTSCDTRNRVFDADSISDSYLTSFLDSLNQDDLSKENPSFSL